MNNLRRLVVAIDPGKTGGMAIFDGIDYKKLIDVESLSDGGKCEDILISALEQGEWDCVDIVCERVHPHGFPMAIVALSENVGEWLYRVKRLCNVSGVPYKEHKRLHPTKWQSMVSRLMGVKPPKGTAAKKKYYGEFLQKFYPAYYAKCLGPQKGYRDGRGDAICIGLYFIDCGGTIKTKPKAKPKTKRKKALKKN